MIGQTGALFSRGECRSLLPEERWEIPAAGDALDDGRRVDLAWVAAGLRQLGPFVPEATLEAGLAWLTSLSRRLNAPAAPRWRAAQGAELQMMCAHIQQGRAAAGLVEADPDALRATRERFAEALIEAVGHDGPPAASWPSTLGRWMADDPPALTAALNALDAARHLPSKGHRDSASVACAVLADFAMDGQRSTRCADMPRDLPRTAMDLLVHLSALIERVRRVQPPDVRLEALSQRAARLFLSHRMSMERVAGLLRDALQGMVAMRPTLPAEERALAAAITETTRLLTDMSRWLGDAGVERGQLHDNPHGRVFDSLVALALIRRPPESLMAAVATMCAAFRRELIEDPLAGAACLHLCEDWRHDPRGWMPAAPGLPSLLGGQDGAPAALRRVLAYLDRPMDRGADRGLEVVARVYLLVYLSVARGRVATRLELPGALPAYLGASADRMVDLIHPLRTREPDSGPQGKGRGIGITLAHQPPAAQDPRYRAVERAAWTCRPGAPQADGSRKFSPVVDVQHRHGQPFASGLSGCTSVLLHLFAHLRDEGLLARDVHAADVLLAAAMTLIHDGGHSLFEVFWVGDRLSSRLAPALGIPRVDRWEDRSVAASDLNRIAGLFQPETASAVRDAMATAWQGTLDYFERHHPRGGGCFPRAGVKPPANED
ncbi:hypothetical protein CDL60_26910 [Roseateles noduli]|nr:hypothetical protein CDL60_26910 [Roseateles noduli]